AARCCRPSRTRTGASRWRKGPGSTGAYAGTGAYPGTGPYVGEKWRRAVAPGIPPEDNSVRTSRGTVSMSVSFPHDAPRPLLGMGSKPRGRRPPTCVFLLRLCYGPAPSRLPGLRPSGAAQGLAPATEGTGNVSYQQHSNLTRVVCEAVTLQPHWR